MTKEKFIKAFTAGGDCGEKHAEKVFSTGTEDGMCTCLDKLMYSILMGDTPEDDILYAISQLQSALNSIND